MGVSTHSVGGLFSYTLEAGKPVFHALLWDRNLAFQQRCIFTVTHSPACESAYISLIAPLFLLVKIESLLFISFSIFIWLCLVLAAARRILDLHCGHGGSSSRPRDGAWAPALRVWSLGHRVGPLIWLLHHTWLTNGFSPLTFLEIPLIQNKRR